MIHSARPTSSDHYSHLKVDLFSEILKNKHAKIVITTGRDCGSGSWINYIHTCPTSVRPQNLAKQNKLSRESNVHYYSVIVGLAEGIIDELYSFRCFRL